MNTQYSYNINLNNYATCANGSLRSQLSACVLKVLEAKARGVASLDALGQLEVRQAHPPPRSIDFAGAD